MRDMKVIEAYCDFCKSWAKVVSGPGPDHPTICNACATEAMFALPCSPKDVTEAVEVTSKEDL